MHLLTCCQTNMDITTHRKKMIWFMQKPKHKKIYCEKSYKIKPIQGLDKDIFDFDHCWIPGNSNKHWLFAALGLTIQLYSNE